MPRNFRPTCIKDADVKILYMELRKHIPELPANLKHFRGFNLVQLNKACQHLKINGFIFNCEMTTGENEGRPGCLS